MRREKDVPIDVRIAGEIVTFTYSAQIHDGIFMERPGVARYRVNGTTATRIAPVATTLAGFIDEWIHMNPADAPRWSDPDALQSRAKIQAARNNSVMEWRSFARCNGAREVGVQIDQSLYVFSIRGDRASDLRMVSVRPQHSPNCTIASFDDFTALATELP
jgi:hypothetical protein